MANYTETYASFDKEGNLFSYVYLDSSETVYCPTPDKYAFSNAVEWTVGSKLTYNYPVVFISDLKTSDGRTLEKIDLKAVPPAIKRKMTNWLKYQ